MGRITLRGNGETFIIDFTVQEGNGPPTNVPTFFQCLNVSRFGFDVRVEGEIRFADGDRSNVAVAILAR